MAEVNTHRVELVTPALEHLPSYVRAVERGWLPDNLGDPERLAKERAEIERDPRAFVAGQVDREAKGPPIVLPDGSSVPRLPGYRLWIWDGEVSGVIGFRWRPGT